MQSSTQPEAVLLYIPNAAYRSHQSTSLGGAFDNSNLPQNLEVCVRVDNFEKFAILREACRGYVHYQGSQAPLPASTSPYIPLLLEIAAWLKDSQPGQIVRHPRTPVVGWYRAGPNGTDLGARCLNRDTGVDAGLEVPRELLEPVANFLKGRF
ncbi:hypothetical protein FA13DRAFT_1709915 [Coprinellus micaceus]|uniref:Uncharacterized protein n=1 Tax=Coprinellus micaceus TaxID=71717 RepID=A0A4Y7TAU9_COPMI|nr:hypothetical protein FA13DRAFT_1709915 [Coprinellus micaceus]